MKIEADSLGEEQFGKFGEQEEEPVTEQRREYTDIGSDFRERDKLVACYASALVLEMKDGISRGRNVSLTIFITCMSLEVLKRFPEARKGKRKGSEGDIGEEQLPKEQPKRVGVTASLRGRESEEIIQSDNSSSRG